jgi:hypothetical protein
MPRKLTAKTTFDDAEDEVLFTTSMVKADPDASDLVSMTDSWLGIIDGARAKDRTARTAQAMADAARVVSNHHLDIACTKFGDDLFLAVDKDRTQRRWIQFFVIPVGRFIRIALAKQVARVRGWLDNSKDPVLEKHRDPLDQWSKAAAGALEKTSGVALVRGEASIAREQMAEDLTNERDGLHDALSARARERGLSRDWPDLFFRTQTRTKPDEPEAPEEPPPAG